jgi:putative chitinase
MHLSRPPYLNQYVASLFPMEAASRIAAYWPLICRWLAKYHASTNENLVIYTLATIRAETWPVFSPAAEQPSKYTKLQHDGQLRQFGKYDVLGTNAQRNLGNLRAPEAQEQLLRARHGDAPLKDDDDGFNFRGRGFVQLTGRWNYTNMQSKLGGLISGLDLVNKPDQAADPEIAAQIIAIWVGLWKTSHILHAMQRGDYVAARHAVNHKGLNMEAFMAVINAHERNKAQFEHLLQNPNQRLA